MSKQKTEVQDVNEVETQVAPTEAVQPEAGQISIQISDIMDAMKIIEVAIDRSAFKAPELVSIMPVYQKLLAFAQEVQKAEKQGE